jgi:hypothetical protein
LQALVNEEQFDIANNDSMNVNSHTLVKQVEYMDREDFDDEISS